LTDPLKHLSNNPGLVPDHLVTGLPVAFVLAHVLITIGRRAGQEADFTRACRVQATTTTAFQNLRPLVLGDDALHLQKELIFRRFANCPIEEYQFNATTLQLIDQEHLMHITPSQAIWRKHVKPINCSEIGGITQLLQRRPHEGAAGVAVINETQLGIQGIGDRAHPFDVFSFWPDHSAAGVDAFLKDRYCGYLNADALNVYDHLFTPTGPTELGCWTHARRKFHEAEANDRARAHTAMAYIRQLYAIEKEAREFITAQKLHGDAADEVFLRLRQEKALPVLTNFKTWLEAEQPKVLPKSLIGLAIAYTVRHWQALERYTTDGFLDIDNNVAERALRQIAVGRKNWIFAGSVNGAETAATLFTITSSCHRHKVDAFAYLRDLLKRFAHDPHPPPGHLRDWLPDRWAPPTTTT
jgi:Transposase IS66 family